MDRRVVVENSLKDHIEFLEKSGYQVEKIDKPEDANNVQSFDYDAIVLSNMNDLSTEIPAFRSSAPIVEAKNKTPEEVYNILRGRY